MASAAAPTPTGLRRLGRVRDAAQSLGLSIAVWVLYVPHYGMLWLLGPRLGMIWVRLAANAHWLLTFAGAQRSARKALENMSPFFQTRLSISQILRRHLHVKHECFARARVYNVHGGDAQPSDLEWRINPTCVDAAPLKERQRGLIVVGFHFNFFQLSAAPLSKLLPGANLVQLRYRNAQCAENTASPIIRLAAKKAMEADRRSGAKVFYVDETAALVQLYRLLRHGGVAAVAADGMVADDFVDVPFFDGTLRVPSGWAKLAAATGSDILLLCDKRLDRRTRDGWLFNHVRCTETTTAAAYATIAESVRILEQMIREEPWGWHPWQRLRVEIASDGVRRYHLKQFGSDDGEMLAGKASQSIQPGGGVDEIANKREAGRHRPRVAVLANSLTPYRVHLHRRIVEEVPGVDLWSLSTHGNAYQRWSKLAPPAEIRPVNFGHGEPTNEQTQHRYAWREWLKGGRIIRWLREHDIEAVFCQGCGDFGRLRVMRWCRRRDIPCFLTGDFNICSDNHRPVKRWMKRLVYGQAVRWSYGLMPCGEHGLALLNRYGGETKPALMFPFVPDIELFSSTPTSVVERAQQRFGLSTGRRRIVFSARMMPAKRPDLAINAFAQIADKRPEWDLVMVGDGALRKDIEANVPTQLRDRVIWTGFLDDAADVAGIYASSDALLLPSDHEPWGVVVVEAAAAGLAIVASDVVGAAPELIHPGRNGALFAAGDLQLLIAALLEVTDAERIDAAKLQSKSIVSQWLDECDPVISFRKALQHCGLEDSAPREFAGPLVRRRVEIATRQISTENCVGNGVPADITQTGYVRGPAQIARVSQ
jgi:glycosyltransferase involved in cell wall biosynthesis